MKRAATCWIIVAAAVFCTLPLAQAARVGDPTLVDPQVVSATSVVQDATRAMMGGAAGDKNSVSIETAGKGPLAPDQPAPPQSHRCPPLNSKHDHGDPAAPWAPLP